MKKLFVCVTLAMLGAMAVADDSERERLINILESSDNLVANFEQKTFKEASAHVDVSSGTLSVSKPLKFNWTVTKPFEQQVISDGETLWVFDPDLEQATYQPISTDLQQSPAMILVQPRQSLTNNYQVFEVKNPDMLAYKLYPVDENAVFNELMLVFVNGTISEIRIYDSLGQETVISFSNVKVGQNIADTTFEFTPPAGTDLFPQM